MATVPGLSSNICSILATPESLINYPIFSSSDSLIAKQISCVAVDRVVFKCDHVNHSLLLRLLDHRVQPCMGHLGDYLAPQP